MNGQHRSRWRWRAGAMGVMLGAILAVGAGVGVPSSRADNEKGEKNKNPFTQILNKLDQILDKLLNGGGGGDGHHTLRWDQALPAAQRFVILPAFNSEAVLDKNTGLVWERSPQTTTATWNDALYTCINKNVGGQKGWRLPSIAELASLSDPSVAPPGPTLPPGHPFLNVQVAL